MSTEPTSVMIVGAGYRAQTFARVICTVPDRFRLAGAVIRSRERATVFAAEFDAPTWPSITAADLTGVDVVVVAVPAAASAGVIAELAGRDPVVLAETPPGADLADLEALCALEQDGLKIQVAEQYHLEPLISAQLRVAAEGALGQVNQTHVSVAHGYHGVSLLRRALSVGFQDAEVRATTWRSPVRMGPSRYGDPDQDALIGAVRTLAWLDFGDRYAILDFDDQQYRSWVRSPTLTIRGTDGELRDTEVRRLIDYRTPVRSTIERISAGAAGNHEGMYLRGYVLDGNWLFHNDYLPRRLADDELAIARLLEGVGRYARGGPSVYSLAEAAQDRYLDLTIQSAAASGERIRTVRQLWART